ncbi:efflux transporter outer membrane subunit [Segnochrobactrum spirostomi]|uniref:Efflux transporter outer membrane subunit n=1 Tax=Segnochrobactrum spirostomi TaxID=2608987 RepID=A0A6A7Y372_9HYPH|nr:efflux transporter outer membrane subunit [Segnochrobactrum spirostomi]
MVGFAQGSKSAAADARPVRPSGRPALRTAVLAAAASSPFLLAGCMVGPNFKPPDAPAVSGYTAEPKLRPTASTAAAGGASQSFVSGADVGGSWWTEFGSPQINAFVEEAVRNHPDIKSAQYALRAARETVLVKQGGLFPTVNGSLSGQREQVAQATNGTTGPTSIYSLFNTSVSVSYTLDVFGGTRRGIESAQAQAEYQRFQLEATYLTLIANVVTTTITDASLRDQIAATQDIIKAETDQLQRVQHQFELGAVPQSDVLSQQATLAQTQATLPPLQKQLAQGRNQLMAYLGRLPNQDRGEHVRLSALRLPRKLPVSLPSSLVRQRPDIRQSEATLHQAAATVGVDVANLLPQVNLTPSFGTASLDTAHLFSPDSIAWSVAASIQQTLFDGGKLYRTKEADVATFEQDYQSYQSTVITAFQNVADSLRAVQYDASTLNAQMASEKASLDSLKMAQEQFKVGAIGYATVINAQQTFQNAVISRVQAQAARFSDTVALYQSLGGGWWNRTDETKEAAPRKGGYLEGPSGPGVAATQTKDAPASTTSSTAPSGQAVSPKTVSANTAAPSSVSTKAATAKTSMETAQ